MNEDILSLLLQTEDEYHDVMKHSLKEAENYVGDRRNEQEAYIEQLKRNLVVFEENENDRLEESLLVECGRMEDEAARLKEQLRICQQEKADRISGHIKEEVLSLLWR